MYRIELSGKAKNDYSYWISTGDTGVIKKITELLEDIAAYPFTGTGKPERLKYELSGKWSRRINSEHRIIYSVNDETIEVYILAMRYHYSKKD
jgi:toxin YoeB